MGFNFDGGLASKLTIGANGKYDIDIHIQGIAAHAGLRPQEGVSAIAIAGIAIADLQRNGWLGRIERNKESGVSNIGIILGGSATNVVAESAAIKAEVRSHDPGFRRQIVDAYRKAFEDAASSVHNAEGQVGSIQFQAQPFYEAYRLNENEPCIAIAEAAVRSIGGEPIHTVTDGGIDANWINAHGIPMVSLGCGQEKIHTIEETLYLPEFHKACRIALLLATASEEPEVTSVQVSKAVR